LTVEGLDRLFEGMVHEHQDRLYALGYALTGNRHDAEEVAQDTLLRAFKALQKYPPERVRDLNQRPWLHRIAVNVARNRHRGAKPLLVALDGTEPDAAPGPESEALQRVLMNGVMTSLAALPPRYREAVVLRYVQDLPYGEVAEALEVPVGTAKSDVHRALKMLRGEEKHDRNRD
jgi:RNA polymerase sigma-70 factor (ECF subfamily)